MTGADIFEETNTGDTMSIEFVESYQGSKRLECGSDVMIAIFYSGYR